MVDISQRYPLKRPKVYFQKAPVSGIGNGGVGGNGSDRSPGGHFSKVMPFQQCLTLQFICAI